MVVDLHKHNRWGFGLRLDLRSILIMGKNEMSPALWKNRVFLRC